MAMLPVDASTISTLAVVCAVLVFVFAFSSGMKPAAALLVAVVVGFVLKAIGIIPIGFMAIAIFSLVVGIFKNLMGKSSDPSPQVGLPMATQVQESKDENKPVLDSCAHDFLTQEAGAVKPLNSIDITNPIHTEPKKPSSKSKSQKSSEVLVILFIFVVIVIYLVVTGNKETKSNYQPTYSSNNPTPTNPPVTPTVTDTPQAPTKPVSQANQEALLMQKCDAFAVEYSRKSYTLTGQERKDDYDKLYNSCLAEERKISITNPTIGSTATINETGPNHEAGLDSKLLEAYQSTKIDNDNARRLINDTWDRLPEQSKSILLKEQRAWVKSKQRICGKVHKNNELMALTDAELQVAITLLMCDTNANLQRAKLFRDVTDEVGHLIKNNGQ